jgi:hypothetical protein
MINALKVKLLPQALSSIFSMTFIEKITSPFVQHHFLIVLHSVIFVVLSYG